MSLIDADTIETLLRSTEGDVLDFKEQQYPFAGATDEQKSELVKDIVAFANAWKTTDAHICIGVRDGHGQRATVVGNVTHIDDARLQQLVNSKTNRRVAFEYIPTTFEGHSIGIIRIAQAQERPIFLRKKFGKLSANEVYIRHGSSTAVADPEEIASMGARRAVAEPTLVFGLRAITDDRVVTGPLRLTSTILEEQPKVDDSVVRKRVRRANFPGWAGLGPDLSDAFSNRTTAIVKGPRIGEPTTKQIQTYLKENALLTGVVFEATNRGQVLAEDIRIELRLGRDEGLVLSDESPTKPESLLKVPVAFSSGSRTSVDEYDDHWLVTIELGKIQPGATNVADPFWMGSHKAAKIVLTGGIFGDNLQRSIECHFPVSIKQGYGSLDAAEARFRSENEEEQ